MPTSPADGTAGTRDTDPALTFPFLGGRACLDFVATLGKRHAAPVERLTDPAALARWITGARLHSGKSAPPVTPGDLGRARMLREALYRLIQAAMHDQAPDPADVAQVNEAAAQPDLIPQLSAGTELAPYRTLHWQAPRPAPAALATVARDAVLLVSGPLLPRVKECENPGCSLLFLDDSQARRRRWCAMERCGNLAKVAGYRSRSRRDTRD